MPVIWHQFDSSDLKYIWHLFDCFQSNVHLTSNCLLRFDIHLTVDIWHPSNSCHLTSIWYLHLDLIICQLLYKIHLTSIGQITDDADLTAPIWHSFGSCVLTTMWDSKSILFLIPMITRPTKVLGSCVFRTENYRLLIALSYAT